MNKMEYKNDLSLRESLKILFKSSKAFWLINIINFFDGITYFGTLIFLTRFLGTKAGMNDVMTGITVSSYTGIAILFVFLGGFIVDKLGVRRCFTLSLTLIFIGRTLLTIASIPGQGTAASALVWTGILISASGSGIINPSLYTGVKKYINPKIISMGYGFLYSVMNLGVIVGCFISPFIRTDAVFLSFGHVRIIGLNFGLEGVFWAMTLLSGATLLIHLTFFSKNMENAFLHTDCEKDAEKPSDHSFVKNIRNILSTHSRFVFFIFMIIPVRMLFAHQILTMPDYIFRVFPKTVNAKFEWIDGLNPLLVAVCVPVITMITRKTKVFDMIIIGTAISAVSPFLLAAGPNLTLLLTYMIVFAIGEATWAPRFFEYVAKIAPANKTGAYVGLTAAPLLLAKTITGWYSGFMLSKFIPSSGAQNPSMLWSIYALFACITPLAFIIKRKQMIHNK